MTFLDPQAVALACSYSLLVAWPKPLRIIGESEYSASLCNLKFLTCTAARQGPPSLRFCCPQMDSLKGPAFCSRVICSLAQLKTWASHSPCPLIEHHADCFPQRPAQSEIKQKRPSLPSQQIHIIPNQSPPLLSLKQTVARPSHECSAGFPKFPPVHVLSN